MEVVDNRNSIYELDEIFKYKNLIERSDRDVIKAIIYDNSPESKTYYNSFVKLVADEVDHQLNKAEFTVQKDKLISAMEAHLNK